MLALPRQTGLSDFKPRRRRPVLVLTVLLVVAVIPVCTAADIQTPHIGYEFVNNEDSKSHHGPREGVQTVANVNHQGPENGWDLNTFPSPYSTDNLIFDTAASLLQHWPNTRYRNGELSPAAEIAIEISLHFLYTHVLIFAIPFIRPLIEITLTV